MLRRFGSLHPQHVHPAGSSQAGSSRQARRCGPVHHTSCTRSRPYIGLTPARGSGRTLRLLQPHAAFKASEPSKNREQDTQQQPRHDLTTARAYAGAVPLAYIDVGRDTPAPQASGASITVERSQPRPASSNDSAFMFVAPNWEPLVGQSRQHLRVEKEVLKASTTHSPLYLSGDAGLDTLRLAATVHALGLTSQDTSRPMVVIDCSTPPGVAAAFQLLLESPCRDDNCAAHSVDVNTDSLLKSVLTSGTLVLHNIDKAPDTLLASAADAITTLMMPRDTRPAAAATAPGSFLHALQTRLVLVSQLTVTQILEQQQQQQQNLYDSTANPGPGGNGNGGVPKAANTTADPRTPAWLQGLKKCTSIALPSLRARPSDINALAVAAGSRTAALRGYSSVQLSDAAQQQLTSYDFPGNEAELRGLVQRAILRHPPAPSAASSSSRDSPCSSRDGNEQPAGGCCGSSDGGCNGSSARAAAAVLTLDAGDFWAATGDADRGRVDVLELLPGLKHWVLGTGLWPLGLNRLTAFLYPLVLASLFLGPQERESSAALTVFWAGWWPLVMLSYPLVGRAWCAMCPFMITGEAAQELMDPQQDIAKTSGNSSSNDATSNGKSAAPAHASRASPSSLLGVAAAAVQAAKQRVEGAAAAAADSLGVKGFGRNKWPNDAMEPWAGWFVVGSFAAILMWEQVWDLPGHAALSGWLLLLITAGAVACSVVFEKRLWCRYLCPIGAMSGLFAKLSMTEIRSRPGLCSAAACTKPCHKGRVEHTIKEVPCSSPGAGTTTSWLSIMPWLSASKTSTDTCCDNSTADCTGVGSEVLALSPGGHNSSSVTGFACSALVSPAHSFGTSDAVVGGVSTWPAAASNMQLSALAPGGAAAAAAAGGGGGGGGSSGITRLEEVELFLPGCPLNSYPGKNNDNHLCIMCGNCLRSCESGSAQWRLRPPAADLWGDHTASWTELHLMNVLLGSVLLHRLPEVCAQLGLSADQLTSDKGPHLLLCAALLAAPSALGWLFHMAATPALRQLTARTTLAPISAAAALAASAGLTGSDVLSEVQPKELSERSLSSKAERAQEQQVSWLRMSYSALPMVWAGVLAHFEQLMFGELGLMLPRLALSLGFSPDTSWLDSLPSLGPAPDSVITAAQGVTLFLGAALSWVLAGKIGSVEEQHGRASALEVEQAVLQQRLFTLLIAAELWHIIL